jgi:hypothetical protein
MPKTAHDWFLPWCSKLVARCVEDLLPASALRPAQFDIRWHPPEKKNNYEYGFQAAPVRIEVSGGEDDGSQGYVPIVIDLQELAGHFDELMDFGTVGSECGCTRVVARGLVRHQRRRHRVQIELLMQPFHGQEPLILDHWKQEFREKKGADT